MGFDDVEEAFRRIGDWRSGRARSLRSPAARAAFEKMLPTLMRAVAAGPEPVRALNRFSDIVDKLSSGVNLYRLLERAAAAGRLARADPRPCAAAGRAAWAAADAARRADRRIQLRSAARRRDAGRRASSLRSRASRSTWRSTAFGGWSASAGSRWASNCSRRTATRLSSRRAIATLPRRRSSRLSDGVEREFARTHGEVPGGELIVLGLGPARRAGADPCQRPRPHLSVRRTAGRPVDGSKPLAGDRLLQPAGEQDRRGVGHADRGGAALRHRHAAPPAGRAGHAGGQP